VETHAVTRNTAILASRAQVVGLPASAISVMFGIVLLTNVDRFGVGGVVMGAVLVVAGVAFGVRLFRSASRRATQNQYGENDS